MITIVYTTHHAKTTAYDFAFLCIEKNWIGLSLNRQIVASVKYVFDR